MALSSKMAQVVRSAILVLIWISNVPPCTSFSRQTTTNHHCWTNVGPCHHRHHLTCHPVCYQRSKESGISATRFAEQGSFLSSLGRRRHGHSRSSLIQFADALGEDADMTKNKGVLSRLQQAIPPANERQKLIPLALMFFCILFNYTILRDTKDVLMVNLLRTDMPSCLYVQLSHNNSFPIDNL